MRQATAWLMKHKLMQVMAEREATKLKLGGGSRWKMPISAASGRGGKRGRGAADKTPFVASVETTAERRPRRPRLTVVEGFRKKEVEKIARADIAEGKSVVTDGLSSWRAVETAGCRHWPMNTGSGRQAARWAPFTWVNTALAGTYHHVSAKHAQRYYPRQLRLALQSSESALHSATERLAWACIHAIPQPYRVIVAG